MSLRDNSLQYCSCVVVGYHGDSRNLVRLAHKSGFGAVQELNENPDIQRPEFPLTFFLVNHPLSDQTKDLLVRRLRRSSVTKLRFAPIIAVGEDVEFEVLLKHIGLGFDDFISLPEKVDIVISRLLHQLDTPRFSSKRRPISDPTDDVSKRLTPVTASGSRFRTVTHASPCSALSNAVCRLFAGKCSSSHRDTDNITSACAG